jgi:hypothetical protein
MKLNHFSFKCFVLLLALTFLDALRALPQTGSGQGTAVWLNGSTGAWLNVPRGTWFSGNFTVEAWVNVASYNS